MSRFERLNLTSRLFCISAILGLSLALFDASAVRGTLLLAAIGATAVAADLWSGASRGWIATVEGALVGLVIGATIPDGVALLPYLIVPSLIAGVTVGFRWVLVVLAAESLALGQIFLTAMRSDQLGAVSALLLPWLVTSLGVGLLGGWVREMRSGSRAIDRDESYQSARRLLTQLRTVARRLSSGLDPVPMASQLLVTVNQRLDDTHAALFVKTEGGVFAPLGYRGADARTALLPDGPLVERCWAEMHPSQEIQANGFASRRNLVVLPLRSGDRMIGIVLAHTAQPVAARALVAILPELDEQALRLDTALAFDEVRSIATLEERRRLAREIHDGIAQEIASLGYAVDDLAANASSDGQRRKLHSLRAELTRVVSELRLSIFDLKSEVSGGLGSALSDYVREVGARSGMTVHLTLDESPTRLRAEIETELLRIAQEAITNARKHASAEHLWVDCRIRPPFARIMVRDDGRGMRAGRADSYGLGIMKERASRIGARLDITPPTAGGSPTGTEVVVTVGDASRASSHSRKATV